MSIVQNIGVFETESSRELQDKCIDTLICAKFSDKSCNKCAKNEGKHKCAHPRKNTFYMQFKLIYYTQEHIFVGVQLLYNVIKQYILCSKLG